MEEVPNVWIFENYLTLPEKLEGQDVNMKSVFTAKDKNPSFFVYHSRTANKYKFKDFSTGKQGDGIELVKELFGIPRRFDAGLKIINDYNDFILNNDGAYKLSDFKVRAKYIVKDVHIRNWNESDVKYWMKYRIGSKLLEFFNVQPLTSFILGLDDGSKTLKITSAKLYGFFRADGTLYKIYQPLRKDGKFFKVKDYIQGLDQLTFKLPYLIICSSLKDGMAFTKLGFKNAEIIAPDSENIMIPERIMIKFKEKYKAVCTLFDNDEAGIKAMLKYKEKYKIPGAHLKLEKDLADCLEIHGIKNTRELLYPVLTKALTGTIKQLP